MADRQQAKHVSRNDAAEIAEKDAALQQDTEHGRREAKQKQREEKLDDIDELLDEIDGLLEENASEVLAKYVQRGGE